MRQYIPEETEYQESAPRLKGKGVLFQRTKTYKCGDVLEAELYPVVDWEHSRGARRKKTPEQMRKVNLNNARKHVARLLNTNYGPGDMLIHLTSAAECTEEEFLKQKGAFFRKLREAYRKAGGELRYLYVIEGTGEGERRRFHIHGAINGGVLTRDQVEALWPWGLSRVDRVQKQEGGLTGFALYITQRKSTQERMAGMKRRWGASRNLKKYRATVSDRKFSRHQAAKLEGAVREDARRVFEKKYPGYRLIDWKIRYSDFLPGCYVYAEMERIDERTGVAVARPAGPR